MTAPQTHPVWCEQQHGDVPAHSGQVGADLELGGLTFAVYVARIGDEPAQVQLLEHTADDTALTSLSILQASILRDLLGEALGVLAREAGLR